MQLGGACEKSELPPFRTCRLLSWRLRYATRSVCTSSSSLCPVGLRSSLPNRAPARLSSRRASWLPGAAGPDHTPDTRPASQLNQDGEAAMGPAVVSKSEQGLPGGLRHTTRWRCGWATQGQPRKPLR